MRELCSYFECGRSKRTSPTLRRFRFPTNDPNRCEQWLLNAGNADLLILSSQALTNHFICEQHFKKEDFLTKKLTPSAIPIRYLQKSATGMKQYSGCSTTEPIASTSTSAEIEEVVYLTPPKKRPDALSLKRDQSTLMDISNIPSPKRLKFTPADPTIYLKKRLLRTETQVHSLKRKLKVSSSLSIPRSLNKLPTLPRAVTRMQLHHKIRSPWLSDERSTALSIFYKSPSTYKYLRSKGMILPSPSTINKWLSKYDCRPGINKRLLMFLKLKIGTMTQKMKECVLVFDEMAIKQCVEFSKNKQIVEGIEDLGELGRKPNFAKQALVIILRGLYSNWKLPLSFYFTATGIKAEDLLKILQSTLQAVNGIGLNPITIVCDQSTTNQKLFRLLEVSVNKPYFEIDGRRYYAIFDAPHLIKSIRNNLLDADFVYEKRRVSFQDIKVVYMLDKSSKTGKALPKLSDIHINPNNFQKMNVRLAVQVLSHSVSAALRTAKETGELQSPTVEDTAAFIELINDTFDILNSRTLKTNKLYCRALSESSVNSINILQETSNIMKIIKKIDSRGRVRRPPCFEGLQLTVAGVQQIFETQNEKGYPFLLTARLNQDILENQFSIYRQRGGYSKNPTVRTFQAAFKANCVQNLLRPPKSSNYEDSYEQENLIPFEHNITVDSSSSDDAASELSSTTSSPTPEHSVNLEACSTVYFAGYLVKKCVEKYSCHDCKKTLSEDVLCDEADILLFYKNYNINDPTALEKPSALQLKVVEEAMKIFSKYFKKYWHKRKLCDLLGNKIIHKIHKTQPNWFILSKCNEHRSYIMSLLIRTLIYKQCKVISSDAKSQSTHEKVKILKNI